MTTGRPTRVLIIDDDRKLCALIGEYLAPLGFEVAAEHTGPSGVEQAIAGNHDVVILDVMLPGLDGFEVLKRIRQKSQVPVLMLTARGEETDRIVGLEVGADDYLPKTFSTRELLARLRAVMRRASRPTPSAGGDAPSGEIVVGELRLNSDARVAALGDKPLDLTAIEFDLLECLARARGRVRSREQLIESITDRNYDVYDRSVDVHICSLRKKLGDESASPRFIRTVRAVGYMFINPDEV
ncbi:MAG TPA: response regulator transcription factor [Verrucomicrobiae bacterium]|nr:response regulator transcription factor [Verrucomicrobiae bacterium]